MVRYGQPDEPVRGDAEAVQLEPGRIEHSGAVGEAHLGGHGAHPGIVPACLQHDRDGVRLDGGVVVEDGDPLAAGYGDAGHEAPRKALVAGQGDQLDVGKLVADQLHRAVS